ncbi:transporter substrate-binding domain-containing protein [Streptomyces ochraceiscleroticus]|uniref:Transporter substrate-binding domain-containing protein n=1 Tax=Streptomyces ochraceiscleroticus TaxID=47761 RepID=A0ABW1MSK0_9ACTN|nr:transporter substrate-binding domain-containing protein [Streptomyces ochraceiscleroticus]
MKRAVTLSALACLLAATAAAPTAFAGDGKPEASATPDASGTPSAPAAKGAKTAKAAKKKVVHKLAPSLLDTVPRRGTLRVCTTGDYRPFTSWDRKTETYSGVDIDMARDLAKSLDAKAVFVPTTWASLVADLDGGRCDIAVGGVSITLPRARKLAFSEPTRTDGKTPIVRCEDKDKYRTLEDIDKPETHVVVNPGGTNEEFARSHLKQAKITVHNDNNTIFDEIVAGRADVMMTDASETLYQAKLHPELCSVHPDEPFTFAEKAYALPRKDFQFKGYVDQFVHLAKHDGTYEKYEDEWMK